MIFIVGNSRSGTTMLGRVLGNHSAVHTFGELHFFEQQVGTRDLRERPQWDADHAQSVLERLLTSARDGFFDPVEPGKYADAARAIIEAAGSRDPVVLYRTFLMSEAALNGGAIPCEQTPRYLFFAREILDLYPQARIVNLVRDPRNVLLSQKNKWRRRKLGASNIPRREALRAWANYHPAVMSKLWQSAVNFGRRLDEDPRFASWRFEDLVAEPEKVVRDMSAFLGLEFEPAMIDVPQVGSSTGQDRADAKGISAAQAGSWQNGGLSKTEIAICETINRAEMAHFNYERSDISAMQPGLFVSAVQAAFKVPLAFGLNLMRTKNLAETLRRRLGFG